MKPYPHQEIGRDFLSSRTRAYLADVMGLGKSGQAILAAKEVKSRRTVVVCPASAVPNWQEEWNKWGGEGELEVRSYASLLRGRLTPGDVCILDEAHYVKNPKAKRTASALLVARKSQYAWLLSGTPMPNNPTELYSPISYLWPDILDEVGVYSATGWMLRFCKVRNTPYGLTPYAVRNGAELRRMLRRIMLRRFVNEVDLPPLRVHMHFLPPSDVDLSEYEGLEVSEHSGYTSSLRRLLGTAKAPLVAAQVVEELKSRAYRKVVVMYHHRDVGKILRGAFRRAKVSVCGFDGNTPQAARWDQIQEFEGTNTQVFLAQQQAAGEAINLTSASEMVLVEPDWTPDANRQAIGRIRRIGQDHPCRARIFALKGTIDSRIMSAIHTKVAMQEEAALR